MKDRNIWITLLYCSVLTMVTMPIYCMLPCLTWRIRKGFLSLTCQLIDFSSPVYFYNSRGQIKGQCNFSTPCKNMYANGILHTVTLTLKTDDTNRTDGEWSCVQADKTYRRLVRVTDYVKVSDLDIVGEIVDSNSIRLTCTSCKRSHSNALEFLLNGKTIDTVQYFPSSNTCFNKNGKCSSGTCSCSLQGHQSSLVFEIGSYGSNFSISCLIIKRDDSGLLYRTSTIHFDGNGFTQIGSKDIYNNESVNHNHNIPYVKEISIAISVITVIFIIVCCAVTIRRRFRYAAYSSPPSNDIELKDSSHPSPNIQLEDSSQLSPDIELNGSDDMEINTKRRQESILYSCIKDDSRRHFTVAIDLGTTSSMYAYCTTMTPKSTDIMLNKAWDTYRGGLRSSKTPTCIILDKNMHALCIGYEARKEYSDYFCDGEADNYYFVDRFKMELYKKGSDITEHFMINDVRGRKVSAMAVFSQMLLKMKERIMKRDLQEDDLDVEINWVLCIPAVWSDRAEYFMRKCAVQAGISDDKLNIVVESESASVYIHYLLKEDLLISPLKGLPNNFLVIDLGGGTDDITAHTITSKGKLKELCRPSGGDNGGKKVDAHLWSLFEKVLGAQVMEDLKLEGNYIAFVEEIENINNLISEETNSAQLNCRFPMHLLDQLCQKYHGKCFEEILAHSEFHDKIYIRKERLRINRNLLVEIIANVAVCIVEDIEFMIMKANKKIDNFILVGGFSNSKLVRNKIKSHFREVNLLYPPADVEVSVVKGAVLYGLHPNYIKPSSEKYYNF